MAAVSTDGVVRRKKSTSDIADPNKGFPPEDVEEYRSVFNYFDTEKKGVITSNQLATTLRSLNPIPDECHIQKQVNRVNDSLNGVVKFEDFLESLHTTIRAQNKRTHRKTMYTNMTEERISEIRDAFDMFDYDNDQTISLEELQSVMNSCGIYITDQEAQDIMDEFDTNESGGNLTFDDFLKLMSTKETGELNSEIKEAFKFFDKDGDGSITFDELKTVMNALGEDLSDNDILEMVREADGTGTGTVNYEDFLTMITGK